MSLPPSFIKSVALEINGNYKLDNTPFPLEGKEQNEVPFIGRKQHAAKFLKFLYHPVKKGVFLVTGYRGMGKTSFVNSVLHDYKGEKELVKVINLTLAQNSPKEIDILRLIVASVFDDFKTHLNKNRLYSPNTDHYVLHVLKLLIIPLLFLAAPLILPKPSNKTPSEVVLPDFFQWATPSHCYMHAVMYILILYLVVFLVINFRIYWLKHKDNAYNRIRWLMERCYSTLSEENNYTEGAPVVNIKFFRSEKRTKQYPIANTKEIEFELHNFLEKAKKEYHLEFIFVFDELDKLDPPISSPYLYEDPEIIERQNVQNAYERDLRERKLAIINIITGLKNFFTTARARFIFIAGREMFDASLADISDRQSQISSISHMFSI